MWLMIFFFVVQVRKTKGKRSYWAMFVLILLSLYIINSFTVFRFVCTWQKGNTTMHVDACTKAVSHPEINHFDHRLSFYVASKVSSSLLHAVCSADEQEWLKDYMCCDKILHFTLKASSWSWSSAWNPVEVVNAMELTFAWLRCQQSAMWVLDSVVRILIILECLLTSFEDLCNFCALLWCQALHLDLVNMDKVDFVQKTQMILDSGRKGSFN